MGHLQRRGAMRRRARCATSESEAEGWALATGALTTLSGMVMLPFFDLISAKNQRVQPFRNFSNRDSSHFLESRCVYDRYHSRSGVRDIDELAVRSKCDPFRHRAGRRTPCRMDQRQLSVADQLQIGQRIFENGIGKGAVHP